MLLSSLFHFSTMVGGCPGSARQDAWPEPRWLVVPCGAAGPSERYGVVDSLGSMCVAHNCMDAQGKKEVSVHGVGGDGPQGNTSSNQATSP